MALVFAPSALAAGPAVTVRVEGKTKTLLAPKVVHPKSGWITRGGLKQGECSADSALGALDAATHHRWHGTYSSQYGEFVSAILGENYGASTKDFWEIFVDHVAATSGACSLKPHRGEQLLFAGVPVRDLADYLVGLKVSRSHGTVGQAVTVTVDYWDAKGKAHPLPGAQVTGTGLNVVSTNAHGVAQITLTKAGTVVLRADHAEFRKNKDWYGYVRSAPVRITVTG